MKSKLSKILIFALTAILLFGTVSASAYSPYTTYTYSLNGTSAEIVESPMAYFPYDKISAVDTGIGTDNAIDIKDMVSDDLGNIYISDAGLKRIVVLDESYRLTHTITTFENEYGELQSFNALRGIFVSKPNVDGERFLYACDEGNSENNSKGYIYVFNMDFELVRTIGKPDSALIDSAGGFYPRAIAVDKYGRMFITSATCDRGITVLSPEGEFNGFIGGQKTTLSFFEQLITMITGKGTGEMYAPKYNNITVDDGGFIYTTMSFQNQNLGDNSDSVVRELLSQQFAGIKSKSSGYSPVKKFNSKGAEILVRNGFFDPSGEATAYNTGELSTIVDIAIGAEGAWTIIDSSVPGNKFTTVQRTRMYTYDQQGNLLYAFGERGEQNGNITEYFKAMCYQPVTDPETGDVEYRLLVMDYSARTGNGINVYTPTGYANAITNALRNENNHNYSEAADAWQDVLTENNNLDLAYIGMGKAYYFQGKYEEAMEKLKSAYDTKYYSLAYAESRNDVVSKWLIPIVVLVIVLIVLVLKFLGYAKRRNKATSLKVGKRTYWEELLFAFHLVFHPFDGFWDLKHEKRGSVRAASTILVLTIIAFFYQDIGRGYMFNPRPGNGTIFTQILSIGLPVVLWVISNWCLTTLFEGEGGIKDIYIATCYSLTPLPIFVTLSTILSNVLSTSEETIVTMLVTVAVVWMVILLFFGMVVTHDYTIGKNLLTTLATIVAAAVIIFVFVLFASLVAKMGTLVSSLYNEIANRI